MATTSKWRPAHTLGLFVSAAIGIVGVVWAIRNQMLQLGWAISFAATTFMWMVAGHGVLGMWRGVLISQRNVMSLARMQMILWTIIVISAIFTAAMWNMHLDIDEALDIAIPGELWTLMGVATTSLVGSAMIISSKETQKPDQADLAKTKDLLAKAGDDPKKIDNNGLALTNTEPEMASWSDLITGDETGNAAHLDLSKCQMLLFTIVVAIIYSVSIWTLFGATGEEGSVTKLPDLDKSILALIGISHAGYLTYKAAPHSQTQK